MKLRRCYELFQDENGKFSATRLWYHVGCVVMSYVVWRQTELHGLSEMLLLVYGVLVTAPKVLTSFINQRFGGGNHAPRPPAA